MTLVERFIDFNNWPDSRKSAVAGAYMVPGLLVPAGALLLLQPPALDVPVLVRLFLIGTILCGALTSVAWVAYKRGHSGHGITLVFVVTFQLWAVVVVTYVGGFTSPFLVFPLLLPLFTVIWFGLRMGAVSVCCIFGGLMAAGVLNVAGVVPLAPAMQIRDIDRLSSASWLGVAAFTLPYVVVFSYGFAFVAVAGATLQHQRLAETHTELSETHGRLELAHRLIRRYVPEQVADAVLSDAPESIERHERRKLTVFFSDLVGFTDLSEELEPEDLATVLHDYFTEMSAIAKRHGGTLDDLVGDAILVLFGAPDRTDDHDQALRAVRMATEMQAAMGPLNERWASAGVPETLAVRMGINTGVATVGNFGSAERTKYTALGKQVNVAARIQAQCEPGRVLISHPTWLLVRDEITCTPKGQLALKGLHKPMPAYEVRA